MGVGVEADTGHGCEDGLGCKDKVGEWVVGKGWAGDKCSRSDGGVQQGEGAQPSPRHQVDNTKKTRKRDDWERSMEVRGSQKLA